MSTSSRIELITSLAARHNAEREAALPVTLFLWIASVPSLRRHANDGLLVALQRIGKLPASATELPGCDQLDSICADVVQRVLCRADRDFTAEVDVKRVVGLKPSDAHRVAKLCHWLEMTALFDDLDAAPLSRESCRRHARDAWRMAPNVLQCWLQLERDLEFPACISPLAVYGVRTAAHGSPHAHTRACDVRPARSLLACVSSGPRDKPRARSAARAPRRECARR